MRVKHRLHLKFFIPLFLLFTFLCTSFQFQGSTTNTDEIISFVVDANAQHLGLYLKNDKGEFFRNFNNLRSFVESKQQTLVFAMNGGMYKKDNMPQGLYIENHKVLFPLDTTQGKGNFYLQPNGIFYITNEKKAVVCQTTSFKYTNNIAYATQSGPMLLINGEIHPAFKQGSVNLNIRNGVGILPDNKILFAMSKKEINFYDFALYFKNLGCKNALYLDGFVSRMYLPQEKWIQTDGDFGVMIGVTMTKGEN